MTFVTLGMIDTPLFTGEMHLQVQTAATAYRDSMSQDPKEYQVALTRGSRWYALGVEAEDVGRT